MGFLMCERDRLERQSRLTNQGEGPEVSGSSGRRPVLSSQSDQYVVLDVWAGSARPSKQKHPPGGPEVSCFSGKRPDLTSQEVR